MSISTPNQPHPATSTASANHSMMTQQNPLGRLRPSQVQTNLPQVQPTSAPFSAISASSAASSPDQGSPIMSPEPAAVTNNSSVQPSPVDALRGQDPAEQLPAANFQLPESVLSRKTSANSLSTSRIGSPSAMSEALGKGSIIRRISHRAQKFANRRRQSSVAPTSRDGSIGPGTVRRRSDSNATAPPDFASTIFTDSDDEFVDEFDPQSPSGLDGVSRDSSSASSISPSGSAVGPSIPLQLLKGTWIKKVSKKNRGKRFILVLEPDAAKISWDKARPHKCLYIDDIKELRTGTDIRQYRLDFGISESEEPRWFSILYAPPNSKSKKMMHLIAEDDSTYQNWLITLDSISRHRQGMLASLMAVNDKAVRTYWATEVSKMLSNQADILDEEVIDLDGVERVCRQLHINAPQSHLRATFFAADMRQRNVLNFSEFQNFLGLMKKRDDVKGIYQNATSNPEEGMTFDEFCQFLREKQREDVDANMAAWEAVFAKFNRKSKARDTDKQEPVEVEPTRMPDSAFAAFLTSKFNAPLDLEPQEYTLDRPMNEYFISSSHNTYLLGRQVGGLSSVEGYIGALLRGCRCVEVDCWDGSDGLPIVKHGRAFTTSISFEQVMTTINKYAFVKSRYPLWISLEVHCSASQQEIMARMIRDTFGSRLVTEPLDPSSDKLPSPSELMERVLIKVKKHQADNEPANPEPSGRRRGNSVSSPYVKPVVVDTIAAPSQSLPHSPLLSPNTFPMRLVSKNRVNKMYERDVRESSTSDNDSGGEPIVHRKTSNRATVRALADLGVYCAGVSFRGLDTPDAKAFNHIFSFMESSFSAKTKTRDTKTAFDRHNMRYLMRIYPDRTRITSNNFDPIFYWRRGVQMAALNWQTFDLGMQLNQAMFAGGSDGTGYVLKPPELQGFRVLPEPWSGKRERKLISFDIDVISAQHIMRPNGMTASRAVEPYVEVEVFHPNDKRDKKDAEVPVTDLPLKRQTHVANNGFSPIFDSKFKFQVTTKYPELVFVRWSVKLSHDGTNTNDRPPVATFTAKLTSLKQGYRTLPLLNPAGDQYLFSTLFCNINVNPITTVFLDAEDEEPDCPKQRKGIFGRSNTSPKSSMEKLSFDGSNN